MAGIVSDLEMSSSISDWQDTDDLLPFAFLIYNHRASERADTAVLGN